jgi:DNA repair protein RecN (Recombination protein N)
VIERLSIRDLAVVGEAELELGPGLNALTGETGAGKSLVLGALALLAGARGDAERVREGADEASVEAVVRTERMPELEAELARRGLPCEDHELLVRRTVSAQGRSRAWIGGQLVPVSALTELLGERIEIASQHESQALRRPEVHGRLLDAFGELLALREAVERGHAALRAARAEAAQLRAEAEERARRRDYLEFQVREIDEAKLRPGELAELEAERARLAHAERLAGDGAAAAALLLGDPAASDAPAAAELVARAAARLAALAEIDASLGPLAERLRGAQAELADAGRELERYAEGIEADPARLAELDDRLARLERLRRKYGASEEEILAFRERAAGELAETGAADERLAALDAEARRATESLARDAARLSEGRRAAAGRLARAVEDGLHELALPGARFEVSLPPAPAPEGAPCGPGGAEAPEFLFRADAGGAPRPLRRVASGGELSRVFLALKNALRRADTGRVLVFDEVDTGVSGRVAERVGRALGELAASHQVLCITHLPQVAARAAVHFRVRKRTQAGRPRTEVGRLAADERVEEIARMAGGERVSEATRRHARDLLGVRPPR